MKPRIFIGSSSENLLYAYALQSQLKNSAEVTLWNQGFFELNAGYLEGLIKGLKDCDFGIFIFAPDDVLTIRDETLASVRDNVLFEFGLFMGGLGRERVFFIMPERRGKLRLPTDLLGISTVTFEVGESGIEAALGPACFRILQGIEKLGMRQERLGSPDVEMINRPRILCACSPQYLNLSFEKDVQVIRDETQNISTEVVEMHGTNSQQLKSVLLENHFDIIHICAYVDPKTGEIYFNDVDDTGAALNGAPTDSIQATSFAKLVELAKARLVILATCDSLLLAAKLAKVTNMIGATDSVSVHEILDWELSFYKCISRGVSLSSSFETAASISMAPMLLLMKKDLAFAG
jgi:hypothetical protein